MSEFSRILTNLGLAYGLGSKEQFIEAVQRYAKDRELNDEAIKEIIEQVFDEIELTQRRRKAKQNYEAAEMEHMAMREEEKESVRTEQNLNNQKLDDIVSEMRALRRSVETLIDKLDDNKS